MAWFRKTPQVLGKGVGDTKTETRAVKRVGRKKVEIRRVVEAPPAPKPAPKPKEKRRTSQPQRQRQQQRGGSSRRDAPRRSRPQPRQRPAEEEILLPPETGRKQMLVRVLPHQTQIVILEGPMLVEHYVAREEGTSLAGNVYQAVAKNILPGMEAAFLDFGANKNGVLYVGDIKTKQRNARIENLLKENDRVLVQVVKDAMGAKGARLTGQVSIPGRYLVLVPESDAQGISRRLPEAERQRLRGIVQAAKPSGFGVIVRTAAAGATEDALRADIERLVSLWEKIKADAEGGDAPRLVYKEPELLIRVIREHFTGDFKRLLIDDQGARDRVVEYLREQAPELVQRVQLYEDEMGVFERFHVEDQLKKALDRKVYLKSGGHLVIDRTEALTVIDVNTGKFVGSSSLEETVLQNNLEAAEEIGRQLRLRDIGGIIVIDFIDMETEKHQRMLIRKFKEELAKDKTRTQVFDVSPLGLVEMTRKNVSRGLLENFSEPCPHCNGRGVLLDEAAATQGIPVDSIEDSD